MKQFHIKPIIQYFDSYTEFAREVAFAPTDCIFTLRCLNEKWLKPLKPAGAVLLFEDYGDGEPTDEMIDLILTDFSPNYS